MNLIHQVLHVVGIIDFSHSILAMKWKSLGLKHFFFSQIQYGYILLI